MQYYIRIQTLLLFGTLFALVFAAGPMATSLLAHHNLQANIQSNTGGLSCASNQIGFLHDNNLLQHQCGQCKPGTHGNWRVHGAERGAEPNTQHCFVTNEIVRCERLNIPDPLAAPEYECPINQFCNDEGQCTDMRDSPLFDRICGSGAMCGPGLHCLRGRCGICRAELPVFRLRDDVGRVAQTQAAVCINGEYHLAATKLVQEFARRDKGLSLNLPWSTVGFSPYLVVSIVVVSLVMFLIILNVTKSVHYLRKRVWR